MTNKPDSSQVFAISTLVTSIILIIINIPYYIPIRSKYSSQARNFQSSNLFVTYTMHSTFYRLVRYQIIMEKGYFDLKLQFTSCAFISCFSFRTFIQ